MIYWPTELPAPLIGTTYNPVDPQMRTTMQSGRTLARRKFTVVPVRFQARWVLNDIQASVFEDFYRVQIIDGTEPFEMNILLPQGYAARSMRFIGPYVGPRRLNSPGSPVGIWEYIGELETFVRPVDSGPPGIPLTASPATDPSLWGMVNLSTPTGWIASYEGAYPSEGWCLKSDPPNATGPMFYLYPLGSWINDLRPTKFYVYRKFTPFNTMEIFANRVRLSFSSGADITSGNLTDPEGTVSFDLPTDRGYITRITFVGVVNGNGWSNPMSFLGCNFIAYEI